MTGIVKDFKKEVQPQKKSRGKSNMKPTNSDSSIKKRLTFIDLSRVVIILIMITTHVIAISFNPNGGDRFVYYLGIFGGVVSFTTFLFLSAVSTHISFLNLQSPKEIYLKSIKIIERSFVILMIYYLLAGLSLFVFDWGFNSNSYREIAEDIVRIILFLRVPPFVEFLLSFIIFNFLAVILRKQIIYISNRLWATLLVSMVFYAFGHFAYGVELSYERINLIKGIFVGYKDFHYFPIFQYAPVYFLGLYIGKLISNNQVFSNKFTKNFNFYLVYLSLFFAGLAGISVLAFKETNNRVFDVSFYDGRFPPSIGFLALSTVFPLSLILVSRFLIRFANLRIERFVTYISKGTLSILSIHLVLLFGLKYYFIEFKDKRFWEFYDAKNIAAITLSVITLSIVYLILFSCLKKIHQRFDRDSKKTNRLVTLISLLAFVTLLCGVAEYNYDLINEDSKFNLKVSERSFFRDDNPETWFDNNYKYSRKITLDDTNTPWVKVIFNHKEAFNSSNIRIKDGSDIVVVSLKNNEFKLLPRNVSSPVTESTEVLFKIDGSLDTDYFIYYINAKPQKPEQIADLTGSETFHNATLGSQTEHRLIASTNRYWFIKDKELGTKVEYKVKVPDPVNNSYFGEFLLEGTDIKGNLALDENSNLVASIDSANLNPGIYKIQSTIYELGDELKVYKTFNTHFYVSHPVYLSWTIDWEGFGVSNVDLNDIASISDKYGMPMTHFFNPRIYVKDQFSIYAVSPGEASYYTNWVLDRRSKGDEIGLHLHFYPDLLKEVGVEVNKGAQLVGINRDETYIHAYSEEDLGKIFDWSIEKFISNGLGMPKSFRSGAWMSSPRVLSVLSQKGIVIDSSGRTGGILNPAWAGSTQIPWNLPETVRPYMPSLDDMNSWSGQRINIWEFANNGADSYWFTADDLINRFMINYNGKDGIMSHPQSIVYLSHPHQFTTFDTVKIRTLFDYTNQFKYSDDKGPVLYYTLEHTYNNWDKVTYTNGQ